MDWVEGDLGLQFPQRSLGCHYLKKGKWMLGMQPPAMPFIIFPQQLWGYPEGHVPSSTGQPTTSWSYTQHSSKVQEMNEQGDALDPLHVQNNNQLKLFIGVLLLKHLLCALASSGCCGREKDPDSAWRGSVYFRYSSNNSVKSDIPSKKYFSRLIFFWHLDAFICF